MIDAYLLIIAGKEKRRKLADKLVKMHYVKNIDMTQGEYDLIVEIKAKNELKLDNIVHENIGKLSGIQLVSPLIVKN